MCKHKDKTRKIKDLFSTNEENASVIMVMYDISNRSQLDEFRDFLTEQLLFEFVQDSVYCSGRCDSYCYSSLIDYINANLKPAEGDYVDVRIIKLYPHNILNEAIWGDG